MDITVNFRALCDAKKLIDKKIAGLGIAEQKTTRKTAQPKPPISEFQKNALQLVVALTQTRDTILKQRREYLDNVNDESSHVQIEADILNQLQEYSGALKLLQAEARHSRSQIANHRNAVIDVIKRYISAISTLFAEQQSIRLKRALDHAKLSKLEGFGPKRQLKIDELPSSPKSQHKKSKNNHELIEEEQKRASVDRSSEVFSSEELQMFESENARLYDELSGTEDEVRRIENQLMELAKLQGIFTENVLIQEQQIDEVMKTAEDTVENILAGNISIREAIQKTASFRAWILFVVLVLSFTLLFLDWYND